MSILRLHHEPSTAVYSRELTAHYSRTSFSFSYKPLIWHAGNDSIVASLLKRVTSLVTRSLDPSPLLRHASVYSCCLATNEARRCATRHGTSRRKHRFVYCCVISGACFDVTVLAWRKYATLLTILTERIVEMVRTKQLWTNVRALGNVHTMTRGFRMRRCEGEHVETVCPPVWVVSFLSCSIYRSFHLIF
jgi:hypothetical protein